MARAFSCLFFFPPGAVPDLLAVAVRIEALRPVGAHGAAAGVAHQAGQPVAVPPGKEARSRRSGYTYPHKIIANENSPLGKPRWTFYLLFKDELFGFAIFQFHPGPRIHIYMHPI